MSYRIQNADIIHGGFDNGSMSGYLCNRACGYHPHKIDFTWKKVTCKNCLNIISKHDRVEKDNCIMLKEKQ